MSSKSKNIQEYDLQKLDRATSYYENQARITSTLLAALLALLTFLLVAGMQQSVKDFSAALYVAIVALGANLVLYALGYIAREYHYVALRKAENNKAGGKQKSRTLLASRLLTGMRVLQQLVFIVSVGAVVWFTISYAKLFLNPKPVPQQTQPTSSQSQGGSAPSASEPAPGESPEEHAKEQQLQSQNQP